MSSKANYEYYKSRGTCVHCGRSKAMINSVLCDACADRQSKYRRKQWALIKSDDKALAEYLADMALRYKELRTRRLAEGICPKCGKRPVREGRKECRDCAIKTNRIMKEYRNRRNSHNPSSGIPRCERPSLGFCYFCGQPKMENHRVCEKHYNMLTKSFKLSELTERRKEAQKSFRDLNRLDFMKRLQ